MKRTLADLLRGQPDKTLIPMRAIMELQPDLTEFGPMGQWSLGRWLRREAERYGWNVADCGMMPGTEDEGVEFTRLRLRDLYP